jgi:membrane associated rhomboid family serine protease
VQLIIATGVCFVAYFFTAVCLQAFAHYRYDAAVASILPYVGMPPAQSFLSKAWTLLTYGFFHFQFFGWVSNAIWLYCWGGVVQMLTGHKQVIPLFVYGSLVGGIFWLLCQLIPGLSGAGLLIGSQAGIMALAAAAFTISPDFRFWFGSSFSLSIKVVGGIFVVLSLLGVAFHPASILWLGGAALAGYVYIKALRAGYRPGEWAYDLIEGATESMTPKERKPAAAKRGPVLQRREAARPGAVSVQSRLDELLDKIHRQGYDALTKEEKEFLLKASQNNE